MKCPICGKQTLPGAKLCGPCRAALKRAKDDSVWELPSSQRPGEPQPVPAAPEEWVLGSPQRSAWRRWALGSAALAACAVVGLQFARSGESSPVAVTQPAVAAHPIAEDLAPPALQRAVPTASQAAVPAAAATNVAHTDDTVQPPRSSDHARAPKATRAPEPVAPAPAPVVDPPPVEPVLAPPPPPPQPVRPVDPMQRLQDALGRCGGQDLFSRLGCEYRARTTFCEGHWGESPQCPAPTTNDHGQ
jgi:hypothetical protein